MKMRVMNVNTSEKIILKDNKTLKLSNVLIREIIGDEIADIDRMSYMMESYIKSKGNLRVGPLVNYTVVTMDNSQNPTLIIKLMMQLKNPIHNVESPYKYESLIRVQNCLFVRYKEKEENLQFAYSKLNLHAFENDIKLKGDSFTVFVNKEEDILTADIFMETQREV
jgi:hypothetical protein